MAGLLRRLRTGCYKLGTTGLALFDAQGLHGTSSCGAPGRQIGGERGYGAEESGRAEINPGIGRAAAEKLCAGAHG